MRVERNRTDVGRRAEAAAAAALQEQGYEIVERNYFSSVGEIDIVAKVDDVWVFVEVRSRKSERFGTAAESVDRAKRRRLTRVARHYVAHRAFKAEPACRFDVVTVRLDEAGEPRHVKVIPDAFWIH